MSAVPNVPTNVQTAAATDAAASIASNGNDGFNGTLPKQTTAPASATSASSSFFQLLDRPVDYARPLKVIVIGAGFSGIYLGIRIPQRLKNVELVIYDKNADVGGTWTENKYVGVQCDVPSHSYQYSFTPNTQWSSLYAPGHEIQAYLAATASKYSVDRFLNLSHKVEECRWDEMKGKWYLEIRKLDTDEMVQDSCDVLVNAGGRLNEPRWPDIEGFHDFAGEVMHSAKWNESYDFTNKTTAIIGSGSSAIQIIPQLQRLPATTLNLFVRNRTWISPPFAATLHDSLGLSKGSVVIPTTLRQKFSSDKEAYTAFRLRIEEAGNGIHALTMRGSEANNGARAAFEDSMRERLKSRPDIFEKLLPTFSPGCRRLTPGEGYLEALSASNVKFISTPITRIERHGIRTSDGTLWPAEALICATGFHTAVAPPYAIIGRDHKTLEQHWATYPRTYLSHSTDHFPNLFTMLGPNAAIGSGSLTMMLETMGTYIIKTVRKIQKENIKAMEVRRERVDDFAEHVDRYFERTVFSEACRSWYKNEEGRVTGLWPGSMQHCLEVLRSPRWEDYRYTYLDAREASELGRGSNDAGKGEKTRVNALGFLGNGWTENQQAGKHLAWYLYPEFVDEPVAPRPEEGREYDIRAFSC